MCLKTYFFFGVVFLNSLAFASQPVAVTGHVQQLIGSGDFLVIHEDKPRYLKVDDQILAQDKIVTRNDQSVKILLEDQSKVVIGPSTTFIIEEVLKTGNQKAILRLTYGWIRATVNKLVGKDESFIVKTPTAVMGVRGTEFLVEHNATTQRTLMHAIKGTVVIGKTLDSLRFAQQHMTVIAGQKTFMTAAMSVPARPETFNPTQLRQEIKTRAPALEKAIQPESKLQQLPHQNPRSTSVPSYRNKPHSRFRDKLPEQGWGFQTPGPSTLRGTEVQSVKTPVLNNADGAVVNKVNQIDSVTTVANPTTKVTNTNTQLNTTTTTPKPTSKTSGTSNTIINAPVTDSESGRLPAKK